MNDIDFDELDRAVTSVLDKRKGRPNATPVSHEGSSSSALPPQTSQPSQQDSSSAPQPVSPSVNTETSQTTVAPDSPKPTIPALSRGVASPRPTMATRPTPPREESPRAVATPQTSSAATSTPPSPRPTTPAASRPPTKPLASPSAPPQPTTPPSQPTMNPPRPRTRLAPRPAGQPGRFMDVVPQKKVANTGKDITPASPSLSSPAPQQPTPQEPSKTSDITKPPVKKQQLRIDAPHNPPKQIATPDEQLLSAKTASHPETSPQSSKKTPIASSAKPVDDNTPFLATAKVSKRPLNAAKDENETPQNIAPSASAAHKPPTIAGADTRPGSTFEQSEQKQTLTHDKEVTPRPSQNPPETLTETNASMLPPEFSEDVVNVEANDDLSGDIDRPDTPPALPPEEAHKKTPTPANKPASSTQAAPNIAMSIPKQYQTRQSSPDKTQTPVFDTEEYHAPLTPPAKKKHANPLLWVLIVILLLALGIGLGVAAFYLIGY